MKKESNYLMPKIISEAFEKALEVLRQCSTRNGFYASAGKDGYNAVWSRDSMITSLGASIFPEFKQTIKSSIETLAKYQSLNGQIPNAVDIWENRTPHVDFKTIDSTLWWIIGIYNYSNKYKENLIKKYEQQIQKALNWLACQDPGEIGVLAQLPTSDWQDAFPHKYGYTINTNSLYFCVLNLTKQNKKAETLKKIINLDKDNALWNNKLGYYLAYRWKNHNKYKEVGDWFDSLGNLLAINFNLAEKSQSKKILNYIEKNKINQPYPVKTIYPPITPKSKYWQDYFLDCDAGVPDSYSNGGIWGYNGTFYILALIKNNQLKSAEEELIKLAERNLNGNFPEWTHPITKKHYGKLQAWEAGTYLLAYSHLNKALQKEHGKSN
jgi:glycogen debranching enzyme